MTSFEALGKEQRVQASIQRDVQSLCSEACHFLELDITKPAMELLSDLFFHKMTCYADDLERFAKHAKRTMITIDDCKLLTRRNHALTARLNSLKPAVSTKEPAKRRRTTASVVSSPKRAKKNENTTRITANTTGITDDTTRITDNAPQTINKTTLASENEKRISENVHAPEDIIDNDIEAIDLTFD